MKTTLHSVPLGTNCQIVKRTISPKGKKYWRQVNVKATPGTQIFELEPGYYKAIWREDDEWTVSQEFKVN